MNFTRPLKKIYNKQDVEDNSEAFQEFLHSSDDMLPYEHFNKKVLIEEERKGKKVK